MLYRHFEGMYQRLHLYTVQLCTVLLCKIELFSEFIIVQIQYNFPSAYVLELP